MGEARLSLGDGKPRSTILGFPVVCKTAWGEIPVPMVGIQLPEVGVTLALDKREWLKLIKRRMSASEGTSLVSERIDTGVVHADLKWGVKALLDEEVHADVIRSLVEDAIQEWTTWGNR